MWNLVNKKFGSTWEMAMGIFGGKKLIMLPSHYDIWAATKLLGSNLVLQGSSRIPGKTAWNQFMYCLLQFCGGEWEKRKVLGREMGWRKSVFLFHFLFFYFAIALALWKRSFQEALLSWVLWSERHMVLHEKKAMILGRWCCDGYNLVIWI